MGRVLEPSTASLCLVCGKAELQLGGGEHSPTVYRPGFHPPPQMKKEKAKKGETLTMPGDFGHSFPTCQREAQERSYLLREFSWRN